MTLFAQIAQVFDRMEQRVFSMPPLLDAHGGPVQEAAPPAREALDSVEVAALQRSLRGC